MEQDQSTQSSMGGSKRWIIIAAAIAVIVIIAAAGGYFVTRNRASQTVESQIPAGLNNSATDETTVQPTAVPEVSGKKSSYKDGSYSATGTYSYHSGTEQVGVKLTLTDGVITDVTVTQLAKNPTSKKMQSDFAANYKPMVVGKNIDEVNLSKVSGSSLTPKGFNDALSQIRQQASS